MPVLRTRLNKPVIKANYIIREKVLDFLDKHADNSLNLVIAPAGYGKSVTISQWLDRKGARYGWISLDSDCNDLSAFLDYLVASIQMTYPKALINIQELCDVLDFTSVKLVSNLFINEIADFKEDYILVLDDYHFINNQLIHDLLNEILKNLPEKFKLFILSRKDTPLILSSMSAYGRINEIRMPELSFDLNEVVDLSGKTSTKILDFESASKLIALTEGWIIGLRMAIQLINNGHKLNFVLSNLGNEKQTITKFLMDEVLQPQSQYVRECFFKASVLSRFNKDLLHYLCESDGSNENSTDFNGNDFITKITNNTLFVIPLDSDQEWFRFHHLFSEILYKQFEKKSEPAQITSLHRKASRWFERNQYVDEAITHSLKAGDLEFINQIIEKQLTTLFNNEKLSIMDRWIKMMPAEVMERYVGPNLIHAFIYDAKQDYISMEKTLERAYKLLLSIPDNDTDYQKKWGYFFALQSNMFYATNRTQESYTSSKQALELLGADNSFMKNVALLFNAYTLVAFGKWKEADNIVQDYRNRIPSDNIADLARNSLIVSMLSFLSGDMYRIYSSIQPMINFYIENLEFMARNIAEYYLGLVYYQWNRIDEATSLVDDAWAHRYSGRPFWMMQNLQVKVFVLYAKNEKTALIKLFEQAHQYADALELPKLHQFIACIEVEIALRDKDFSKTGILHQNAVSGINLPLFYFYIPQLTIIKCQIFKEEADNYNHAASELDKLIEFGRKNNNKNILIQSLSLKAILLNRTGNTQGSLANLSEAIQLATPGGFIRVFVDMGEEIYYLILKLTEDINIKKPYLNKILEVFESEISTRKQYPEYSKIMPGTLKTVSSENLSEREIEILNLLMLGNRNKEIAMKLFLSPNSVKKYLYDIYKKLNVKNRTDAINKIKLRQLI